MGDGRTRKLQAVGDGPGTAFLKAVRAVLVMVSGDAAGAEFELNAERVSIGRGDSADLTFDDSAMSREHAVFELRADGFAVRDLGSTNGVCVNGAPVAAADLKHGDRIELGEHAFQYVIEERKRSPKTFKIR